MRTAVAWLLVMTLIAGPALAAEADRRIQELEAERNALRQELAEAKLKIATLEDKLASQQQADPTGAVKGPGSQPSAVVLIPRFETTTNYYGLPHYYGAGDLTETGRNVLEDILINRKMTVIERQRVDLALKSMRGGDDATALKAGKALGADVLISGTILSCGRETKGSVEGRAGTVTNTIEIRLRVINIETGQVVHSAVFNGKETVQGAGTTSKSGTAYSLVKSALNQVNKQFLDIVNKQKNANPGVPAAEVAADVALIEMVFDPSPRGCEVLIDGQYVGTTPYTGSLPAGKAIKVLFRKTGYRPWESTLTPSPTMSRVAPELERGRGF